MSALPDTEALANLLAETTPGQWRYAPTNTHCVSHLIRRDDGAAVAQASSHSRLPAAANASLIALAPALAAQRIADAARIAELEAALREARKCLEGEPEYHPQGMGCGLEDRGITDRYDAMEHGWEQAMERVYGEHINGAREVIDAVLEPRP